MAPFGRSALSPHRQNEADDQKRTSAAKVTFDDRADITRAAEHLLNEAHWQQRMWTGRAVT
jgi:hypothetical protein